MDQIQRKKVIIEPSGADDRGDCCVMVPARMKFVTLGGASVASAKYLGIC